ncbi:hypothetical protein GOODEAATRI_026737, partial [Goodea atripinnis]
MFWQQKWEQCISTQMIIMLCLISMWLHLDCVFQATHMDYVMAAANLYGQIYGIKWTRDSAAIRRTLEEVQVPPFSPKSSIKIHLTDKEMEEDRKKDGDDADKARLEELKGKLSSLKSSAQMYPIDFEK